MKSQQSEGVPTIAITACNFPLSEYETLRSLSSLSQLSYPIKERNVRTKKTVFMNESFLGYLGYPCVHAHRASPSIPSCILFITSSILPICSPSVLSLSKISIRVDEETFCHRNQFLEHCLPSRQVFIPLPSLVIIVHNIYTISPTSLTTVFSSSLFLNLSSPRNISSFSFTSPLSQFHHPSIFLFRLHISIVSFFSQCHPLPIIILSLITPALFPILISYILYYIYYIIPLFCSIFKLSIFIILPLIFSI